MPHKWVPLGFYETHWERAERLRLRAQRLAEERRRTQGVSRLASYLDEVDKAGYLGRRAPQIEPLRPTISRPAVEIPGRVSPALREAAIRAQGRPGVAPEITSPLMERRQVPSPIPEPVGLLEALDLPRRAVLEHAIEPAVPGDARLSVRGAIAGGIKGAPLGPFGIIPGALAGGLAGREVERTTGLEGPEIRIPERAIEEVASYILDPLNAALFAGKFARVPTLARAVLRGERLTTGETVALRTAAKLAESGRPLKATLEVDLVADSNKAIDYLITEARPLSVTRPEAKAGRTIKVVKANEATFDAYEAMEAAAVKLTDLEAELARRTEAGQRIVRITQRVGTATKSFEKAHARLAAAEARAWVPEAEALSEAETLVRKAVNEADRYDDVLAILPEETHWAIGNLESLTRSTLPAMAEAVRVAKSRANLGLAFRAPKPIRGLARAIFGHGVFVPDSLDNTASIIGAAYGRERLVTEVIPARNRVLTTLLKELWGKSGLAGREASLYRGPEVAPGLKHGINTVVSRPDLYNLAENERLIVDVVRRSLDEVALTERLLGVNTELLREVLERQAIGAVSSVKNDPAGVRRLSDEILSGLSVLEKDIGYWPQYLSADAFREATGITIRGTVVRGIGAKQAFQRNRTFKDPFEAAHAFYKRFGKPVTFDDPWVALEKRLSASAHAIGDAQYRQAIVESIPNTTTKTLKKGSGVIGIPGRFFRHEDAQALRSQIDVMAGYLPGRQFRIVANIFRNLKLAWDFSGGAAIQGFMFASNVVTNPSLAARVGLGTAKMVFNPKAFERWYVEHLPEITRMQSKGLNIATNPVDIQRIVRGEFRLWQLPGRLADVLNDANFGRAVTYYKFHLAQQWLDVMRASKVSPEFAGLAEKAGLGRFLGSIKGVTGMADDEIERVVYAKVNERLGGISQALTAKGPDRQFWEQMLDIAPNWFRARTGLYISALKGKGPERYIAINMIGRELALGASVSTMGSLLMTGELPNLTDPTRFDFLAIKTPIGVVPTIPSITIMRLVAREAEALATGIYGSIKEEDLGPMLESQEKMWDAFYRALRGRESPLVASVMEQLQGKDYFGNPVKSLDERARRAVMAMVPIAGEQITEAMARGAPTGELAAVAGVSAIGSSVYPPLLFDRFTQAFEEEARSGAFGGRRALDPKFRSDSADWLIAEKNPRLKPLIEQLNRLGLERGSPSAIAAQQLNEERVEREKKLGLVGLANNYVKGDREAKKQVGPNFLRQWEKLEDAMAEAYQLLFDPKEKESDWGKALQAWAKLEPEQFMSDVGEIDYDAYFEEKEDLFQQLPVEHQTALKQVIRSVDPNVAKVEADVKKARDLWHQYLSTPRWKTVSLTEQRKIEEVQRLAGELNQEMARKGLRDLSMEAIYRQVGLNIGDEQLARTAYFLRSGSDSADWYRNPDREEFLLRHANLLEIFFPFLYRREILQTRLGREGR